MADKSNEQNKISSLSRKIDEARKSSNRGTEISEHHKNANYAWRMVLELVTGMLIGFGIGYLLDKGLGTEPIFIVVMSLFGFAAGVKTMIKTAEEFSGEKKTRELKD